MSVLSAIILMCFQFNNRWLAIPKIYLIHITAKKIIHSESQTTTKRYDNKNSYYSYYVLLFLGLYSYNNMNTYNQNTCNK